MSSQWDDDDDIDDSVDGSEDPSESDMDGSDDLDTFPCPSCGAMIYEEAERCPSCGKNVTLREAGAKKPLWIWLGVLLALMIVVFVWMKLR